jgi:ABC-type dipeptide/oligopeptide/nickel transport system permease component
MALRSAVGEVRAAGLARLHASDSTARVLAMAGSTEKNDAVLRFVARRVAMTIPVLLGVATLVFSLIHLIPGDPALAMLGEAAPEADVAALRAQLGLDRPLLEQYADFLSGLVRGDLGTSLRTGTPVSAQIAERLPATFELALAAMLVAGTVALPLGIAAAAWRGTVVDHAAMAVAMTGMSIPNFWLGPLLAIIFAVELGWLPVSGRGGIEHLVLPAVSLGLALAAILARMTRASLLEELREPYVRAARARGISRARAIIFHAFRNSLIPVVTILGLQFGAVLTGAVITETIFSWPGIGRLLIQSIGFRDYPLVQGCILLIAVTYVAVNLITDLAYGLLDPRIRYQ